uniref:C3H1-type domain-containing protein n=2 Tax=Clastoptera arizonana TaxID=38151 RepID=A0A1B6E8B4_9HEMI
MASSSLVADYGNSSGAESSSEDSSESDSLSKKSTNETSGGNEKLPLPKFNNEGHIPLKNSVFANPFIEAENAKSAILEKHVKMIPSKNNITHINGKQICWMYRKGRCRFGHNCKFAHDSDLYNKTSNEMNDSIETNLICDTLQNSVNPSEDIINNEETSIKKSKKRPGLSQNIVPGKKVLKMYKKQKQS